MEINKFKIQDGLYEFPYHHIPYLDNNNVVVRYRSLNWGYKYLCYLLHIKEKVDSLKPGSVLDVGCGDGRLLGLLSDRIECKVGVDLSGRSIAFAKAFYPGIDFYNKNAADMEESFDVVIAMEVLEHIPDESINQFLKNLEIRAKKGGYIYISVPTKNQLPNKKHYRHYDIDMFGQQLNESGSRARIVKVEYLYREPLWLKVYNKLIHNRLWFWEVEIVNRLVWKYIWRRLRIADKSNGHDMIVTLQKY